MPYTNAKCLKCNRCCVNMAKIGAIIMCVKCAKEEFGVDLEGFGNSSDIYKTKYIKWLKIYKEKYG